VRLLPGFDQYVIAATLHAEALMPGAFRPRVQPPAGLDPRAARRRAHGGRLGHERKASACSSRSRFARVPKWAREAAAAEAERLAGFLGGALELTWDRGQGPGAALATA